MAQTPHQTAQQLLDSSLLDACETGDILEVRRLVGQGANVEARESDDDYNYTPLILSSYAGFLNVVEYLISAGADVNAASKNGTTSLFMACQEGHLDIAALLIKHGVDVNAMMNDKTTPLYIACQNGFLEVVSLLLDSNANMNTSVDNGSTPLIVACAHQHQEIGSLLMKKGADVNARANDGRTALHSACIKGHLPIVCDLVAAGADTAARDETGFAPVHDACRLGKADVVAYLLEKAGPGGAEDLAGWNGNTGLHLAAWKGHARVVWWFLLRAADGGGRRGGGGGGAGAAVRLLDRRNRFGLAPLHLAVLGGHAEVAAMLLNKGAAPSPAAADGETPLHLAALHGRLEAAKLLVSFDADLGALDRRGRTPEAAAQAAGRPGVADYLAVTRLLHRLPARAAPPLPPPRAGAPGGAGTGAARAALFARRAGAYRAGAGLAGVWFVPRAAVLGEAGRLPTFAECRAAGRLVRGDQLPEGAEALFVSTPWQRSGGAGGGGGGGGGGRAAADAAAAVARFLGGEQGARCEYVWAGACCLDQSSEEAFQLGALNVPTAALRAGRCLMVPATAYFPSTFDESVEVAVSDLAGYIGRSWSLLEAMSAVLARAELFLAFQCGGYTGFHRFDRPEVAGSNLGFYQAQVAEWNMLWQSNNQDQTAVRYALEERWQNIQEPCALLQLALGLAAGLRAAGARAEGPLLRAVLGGGLTAEMAEAAAAQAAEAEAARGGRGGGGGAGGPGDQLGRLWRRLGAADRAEDKALVLNLLVLLACFTVGLAAEEEVAAGLREVEAEMERAGEEGAGAGVALAGAAAPVGAGRGAGVGGAAGPRRMEAEGAGAGAGEDSPRSKLKRSRTAPPRQMAHRLCRRRAPAPAPLGGVGDGLVEVKAPRPGLVRSMLSFVGVAAAPAHAAVAAAEEGREVAEWAAWAAAAAPSDGMESALRQRAAGAPFF